MWLAARIRRLQCDRVDRRLEPGPESHRLSEPLPIPLPVEGHGARHGPAVPRHAKRHESPKREELVHQGYRAWLYNDRGVH